MGGCFGGGEVVSKERQHGGIEILGEKFERMIGSDRLIRQPSVQYDEFGFAIWRYFSKLSGRRKAGSLINGEMKMDSCPCQPRGKSSVLWSKIESGFFFDGNGDWKVNESQMPPKKYYT